MPKKWDEGKSEEWHIERNAKNKAWRDANQEHLKEYAEGRAEERTEQRKTYYELHKEERRKQGKIYRDANKEAIKARRYTPERIRNRKNVLLQRLYGITVDEFELLLEIQNNLCPGCLSPLVLERGKYATDHDHGTGQVRWVLCTRCNSALGMVKDDPKILRRLADMLERHNNGNS